MCSDAHSITLKKSPIITIIIQALPVSTKDPMVQTLPPLVVAEMEYRNEAIRDVTRKTRLSTSNVCTTRNQAGNNG